MTESSEIKIIQVIGSIFSEAYFLSPLIQVMEAFRKNNLSLNQKEENQDDTVNKTSVTFTDHPSIKRIPICLLLTTLLNCLFYFIFSLKTGEGSNKDYIGLITNGIGLISNIVILFLFLYLFLDGHIWKFLGYGLFTVNCLAEITFGIYCLFQSNKEGGLNNKIGFVSMIINMLMYASPMTNIYSLFTTKEYQFLPILTNVIGLFTTMIWIIYGILEGEDRPVYSNGISLIINAAQIAFWAYFFVRAVKKRMNEEKAYRKGVQDIKNERLYNKEEEENEVKEQQEA